MAKIRFILFRVTQTQYERIKNNAHAKGHKTLSGYLRDLALNKDLLFEQRFNEMYDILVSLEKKPCYKSA